MHYLIYVAAVVVVLIIYLAYRLLKKYSLSNTVPVLSRIDGAVHMVHSQHKNKQEAADIIAKLNKRAIDLLRHLRNTYIRMPNSNEMARKITQKILSRYNPDNLVENSPKNGDGDTSFTIDKGSVLALCIREKSPESSGDPRIHNFHKMDVLTFVMFHELAHIGVKSTGHSAEFWAAFKFILREAAGKGILRGQDYASAPARYCGIGVDYNPLFDSSIPNI